LKAVDDFMRRPTETLIDYMTSTSGLPRDRIERVLMLGRIAMAMELMTVAAIIDEHSLLPAKEDTIAVVRTLLIDQNLDEPAREWYERLSEWRRIKPASVSAEHVDEIHRGVASSLADLPDALPPRDSTSAQPGTDQSSHP